MNDIKRRIDESEAGGVDEQDKLLELEAAVAKFETIFGVENLVAVRDNRNIVRSSD